MWNKMLIWTKFVQENSEKLRRTDWFLFNAGIMQSQKEELWCGFLNVGHMLKIDLIYS